MAQPRIADITTHDPNGCFNALAGPAAGQSSSDQQVARGPRHSIQTLGFAPAGIRRALQQTSLGGIGRRLAKLTPAALLMGAGQAAFAGGYAVPIIDIMAPPAAPTPMAGPSNYWLALVPLAILFFASRGGDGSSSGVPPSGVPLDLGGPCFGEGTLLEMEDGWRAVEDICVGDRILSSKGVQTVLSVDFWTPTEFRDRPCEIEGVSLSANHGVLQGQYRVPAQEVSPRRERINGLKYYHVLVENHSWLHAKSGLEGNVIAAESLLMTKDLPLAHRFPDLVQRHASDPAAPNRSGDLAKPELRAA